MTSANRNNPSSNSPPPSRRSRTEAAFRGAMEPLGEADQVGQRRRCLLRHRLHPPLHPPIQHLDRSGARLVPPVRSTLELPHLSGMKRPHRHRRRPRDHHKADRAAVVLVAPFVACHLPRPKTVGLYNCPYRLSGAVQRPCPRTGWRRPGPAPAPASPQAGR